jgi:hypothetical protein
MERTTMTALLVLLLAQPTGVFENLEPWKVLETKGGLVLQGRPIKGSKLSEYRGVTDTPYPAQALCEHIYEWATKGTDHPGVRLRKLLKDGPDDRIVYDQIEQSVVSDRDYALTVVRRREPDGTCRIRFWTSNALAPPLPAGFVRMERLWGGWVFEPLPGGKARLAHTLFADPAGSIPAFLVHGPQKSAVKDSVITGLKKVKAALAAKK